MISGALIPCTRQRYLFTAIQPMAKSPIINSRVPIVPNKCMGFLANRVMKVTDNKSNIPLIKRFHPPNLVTPYFLA